MLKLDWSKAHAALGWQPVLPLPEALDYTLAWYEREAAGTHAHDLCIEQIASYSAKLAAS
jgi:CDP-glucose 4,6-dehydratase